MKTMDSLTGLLNRVDTLSEIDELVLGIDEILKSPDELNTKQAGVHLINILHDLVQRHEDCC